MAVGAVLGEKNPAIVNLTIVSLNEPNTFKVLAEMEVQLAVYELEEHVNDPIVK